MKILIFGASGATGHELVKQALAQGHIVTAYVRNPSRLKITHANLKVMQGDVVNYQSVAKAVTGQDAVLSALGASSPFTFDQALVDGVNHIIEAMQQHGVRRFIYMSFAGVEESRSNSGFIIKYIAPKLLSTEIAGHEAREKIIKKSHLQWTIVRPPTLTNGKHKCQLRAGENIISKAFIVTVSRADVAGFMLQQLTDHTFIGRTPLVMN